jgi:hypothetical protein
MGEKKNFVMLSNGMRIERKILNQKNEASNMITKTSISRNPGIRITDRKGTQEEINSTLKKPIKTKNSLSTEMYEKKPAEIQSPTLKNTETYQRAKFKRKKSALSKRKVFSLPPGIVRESFVCFHREFQFYQVKHINDGKVWLLNSKNEELCITFETAVKRRMEHVSPFHIGVLKAFANKENQVVDMLLHAPVNKSIKIIKATGYKPVHFGLMKKFLLGSVFNENQWNEWKNRIIEELDLPKNSLIRPTPQLSKSTHIIKPQNFIVRVQSFNCINKNHTLQSIQAEVPIRTNGSNCITSRIIPAGYCEQCKRYYILSSILEEHYEVMRYALCDFVLDKDINKYLQSQLQNGFSGTP